MGNKEGLPSPNANILKKQRASLKPWCYMLPIKQSLASRCSQRFASGHSSSQTSALTIDTAGCSGDVVSVEPDIGWIYLNIMIAIFGGSWPYPNPKSGHIGHLQIWSIIFLVPSRWFHAKLALGHWVFFQNPLLRVIPTMTFQDIYLTSIQASSLKFYMTYTLKSI